MPPSEPTTAEVLQKVQEALNELLNLLIKKLKAKNARNHMAAVASNPFVLASVGTVTDSNPSDSVIDGSSFEDLDAWLEEAEDECAKRMS